jgi:alpha-beta hydrolase superfamily lysophospholipase
MTSPPSPLAKAPHRPDWLRPELLVAASVVVLLAGGAAARWYAGRRALRELIVPVKVQDGPGTATGIPLAALSFSSGDHTIRAVWVRAAPPESAAPAVLVFHGNRTSVPQHAALQAVLYRAGISSLVFDYSGFGESEGEASPAALRRDARAAFAVFADSAKDASRRVLLGTSLGAAVLLDVITDLQAGVDGVVLVGTFTSAREAARAAGRLPRPLAWLVPDWYDNIKAVRNLRRPLLVVHSAMDRRFPLEGAERLVAQAAVPKRLIALQDTPHQSYLATSAEWRPVLEFIKRGLP